MGIDLTSFFSSLVGGMLRFETITKQFGSFTAVDGVTLEIGHGTTFSLLGPSGCGKTTLLRIAAGFEQPDQGRVMLDGQDITLLPPERRPINTVFQNYALFPHMNVRENIGFGLKMEKMTKPTITREVDRLLELVDLASHATMMPKHLSGGQKQRVGIARALAKKPRVLLLDEPLAALDLKLRQRLLVELDAIHEEVGITFIYVTHDQSEAMSISDHIAVMNQGRIEQIGTPVEIYETPKTSFVAAFIGDTNLLNGRVADESKMIIEGLGPVTVNHDASPGDVVHLSVRPEKIHISREQPPAADRCNTVEGVIEDVIYSGAQTRYWVRCGGIRICADQHHHPLPLSRGENVWLNWKVDSGFLVEEK
jgi:spermidine/putrescine transport system ATP-binding protein